MRQISLLGCLALVFLPAIGFGAAPEARTQTPPRFSVSSSPQLTATARRIIEAARQSGLRPWNKLADLCDRVGPRPSGSAGYAHGVEWALEELQAAGFVNVHKEPVLVDGWKRGREELSVLSPGGVQKLPVTTLGRSVGTPPEGISAPAIVVRDFEELQRRGADVRGKIVVFNAVMKTQENMFASYGETVPYRWNGASIAGRLGAVAVLVRSLTTARDRHPHAGSMGYEAGVTKIPAAAIAIEDAEMLERLDRNGSPPLVKLVLGATTGPQVTDYNIIGELPGREHPEEIVVIGAHFDSWDAACGAQDDAGGSVLAIEAARLLKRLELTPRRTVRIVLFANEERGLAGGRTYARDHQKEIAQHVAAVESDAGLFHPAAFTVAAGAGGAGQLEPLQELLSPLGKVQIRAGGTGPDISPLTEAGVPGINFRTESRNYFDFHHSPIDTADKVDPGPFNDCLAAFSLMTWALAENPGRLPRSVVPPSEED